MFTNRDIADYYNQTLNHYQKWWCLDEVQAVHYGYWDQTTRNFKESLWKLNEEMAQMAGIKKEDMLLDAGCGVGGSLFYLAKKHGLSGIGITLSERQYDFAQKLKNDGNFTENIDFKIADFCHTSFANNTFDVIWAIESVTSTPNKELFAKEVFRLLKPGGKLIIADYYRLPKEDEENLMEKWCRTWSMAPIVSSEDFARILTDGDLKLMEERHLTKNIYPTSLRMFRASLPGAIPSVLYNVTHNTSRFAKTHYLSGIYQYKALKKELWEYKLHLLEK